MAPTSPPEIVVATTSDSERVVALMGLAFSSDPILRWLYPDPLQFQAFFPELTMALGGAAFESGSAYRTGDFSAAALWLPSGVHADEEVAGSVLERSVPEERSSVVFGILEQMEENHPTDEHWYLPWIGVDPIYQGRGLGTAVLQHTLTEIDRLHLPAYLEATSDRNASLYERHGFAIVATIQGGDSPPILGMLRKQR